MLRSPYHPLLNSAFRSTHCHVLWANDLRYTSISWINYGTSAMCFAKYVTITSVAMLHAVKSQEKLELQCTCNVWLKTEFRICRTVSWFQLVRVRIPDRGYSNTECSLPELQLCLPCKANRPVDCINRSPKSPPGDLFFDRLLTGHNH